jgi:PAS domain S-box-containing protein
MPHLLSSRLLSSRLRRYSLPPLTVLAALLLNLALIPVLKFESPFLLFIAAVLLSAWLCGAQGGLLATVTSLVSISLFFWIAGDLQVGVVGHTLRLSMFFAEGTLISLLIARLQDSNARFVGIVDAAMDAIVSVDAAQRIVVFNPAAERLFGCTASEALGQPLARFIPEPSRYAHRTSMAQFHQAGGTARAMGMVGRVAGRRVDGSSVPLEASIAQLTIAGKPIFTTIMRDISERHAAEEAVQTAHHDLERRVAERTIELQAANQRLAIQAQVIEMSEARYRALARHLPNIAILMFDHDLRYLLAEGAQLARHGYDPHAMVGYTLWEIMPAEQAAALAETYRATLTGKLQATTFTRDGQTYSARFVPIHNTSGQVVAGMVVIEDVTAQLHAEEHVRQSEALLKRMGHMAKIGAWTLDVASRQLAWSEEIYRIRELDPSCAPSLALSLTGYPPEARALLEQHITAGIRNGTAWDEEVPLITATGRSIWVRAQGEAEQEHGQVVRLRGTLQDITERRQLQETLRERELIYATLFQVIPIGVTITDAVGQIMDANPAAERLLGLSHSQHQQRRFDNANWDIIRPDGSAMPSDEYASVRALREQRLVADIAMGVRTPGGETTWLNVTATPMPLAGHGVVVVYKDMTVRVQMDQALRRTLNERETMLKEIHHRVKNNLQVVISLLRLQGRQIHDPIATNALRDSRQRVEVMALVHELLYRADDLTLIDAKTYLAELSQQLMRIYLSLPGQIELHVAVTNLWLSLDQAVPCGLIIHELLANSFKYAFPDGQHGTIGIALHVTEPAQITLHVWDSGVGMPTSAPARKRQSLGMQLVYDLARQLRGSVVIDGSAGTSSTITFPIGAAHAAQSQEPSAEGMLP